MGNNEKIDLILNKLDDLTLDMKGVKEDIGGLKNDVSELKEEVSELKEEVSVLNKDVNMLKEKAIKLEKMDRLILDEVERVHEIMDKRTDDLYAKTGYPKAVY